MLTASAGYYVDGAKRYPRVTHILAPLRARAYTGISRSTLEAARLRGQAVHALVEYRLRGVLDEASINPMLAGYLASFDAWAAVLKPEVLCTERVLTSDRHWYGGRMDVVARLKGRVKSPWIIDLKSGLATPTDALQTAAYLGLAVEHKLVTTALRAGLYLHRDGTVATFVPHETVTDFATFLAYRTTLAWEEAHYGNDQHEH